MKQYEDFIAISKYARSKTGRRESWEETVERWWEYFGAKYNLPVEVKSAIIEKRVMPSMRGLMTAGPALDRNHIAAYNCSYIPINDPKAFDEVLIILMHGTGVGYSVERQYITQLPEIPDEFDEVDWKITPADSKEGWQKALRKLVHSLYGGEAPKWDLSRIRPSGAVLKTFGGRVSGPEPLDTLLWFVTKVFRGAAGRKLSSIECHDILCQVAASVVVGGVRRSAMISLSNLTDDRMRRAKMGQWWLDSVNRSYANNSVAYTERPDMAAFMEEWTSIYMSKAGERGLFNRIAAQKQALKHNREVVDFGVNPCGEILLRPRQFCNLTEAVVREDDTEETLKEKVRIASIIGTAQSALTDFKNLSKMWKINCEEERLLGVSLTGIMDSPLTNGLGNHQKLKKLLNELRDVAVDANLKFSKKLGINPSKAICTVKPSGTVSSLVSSASGIHPRYSKYYIRRVRSDIKDPLASWMKENGFPVENDIYNPHNFVFSFPLKSPKNSVMKDDISAMKMLEIWKIYRNEWCHHNPSITVYIGEDEWMDVGAWVYKNWDDVCGLAFLPKEDSDHTYVQAPYETINYDKYRKLIKNMPNIDFSSYTEEEDNTVSSQEFACAAGSCDISNLVST